LIWEKIPLLVLAVSSIITTLTAQKIGGAMKSLDVYPLQERVINALVSYLLYLQKMVWPSGMSVFYPHPENMLPVWKGVLSAMLLVLFTTGAIRMARRAPYLVVGWFWYLGTLVPVIGIVQVGWQAMADRYAYVPLIGIFIIVAWGLPELMAKWRHRDKALAIAAVISIPALMMVTWAQVSHWKSSITIFKHAIRVTDKKYPTFAIAHNNLGNALSAERKFEEAISHFKTAIRLNPNRAGVHANLGNALSAERKFEEAISHFKTAIKLKPDFAGAYTNLGNVLSAERKFEEAIPHYKTAIKLRPDYAEVHYNLGKALLAMRETEEAITHYRFAIKLEPDHVLAHNNLGNALSAERKFEEAISHYKTAIRLNPNLAIAHYNLGDALSAEGDLEEAISHYKIAIKLKPGFVKAHNKLKSALLLLEGDQGWNRFTFDN
jgi:tetratricopeptide (TPR) repeat protein